MPCRENWLLFVFQPVVVSGILVIASLSVESIRSAGGWAGSIVKDAMLFSLHAQPQAVERQIDDRRCIKRKQLAQDQPSHNSDAQGAAELIPRACPQRQRQSAQ